MFTPKPLRGVPLKPPLISGRLVVHSNGPDGFGGVELENPYFKGKEIVGKRESCSPSLRISSSTKVGGPQFMAFFCVLRNDSSLPPGRLCPYFRPYRVTVYPTVVDFICKSTCLCS